MVLLDQAELEAAQDRIRDLTTEAGAQKELVRWCMLPLLRWFLFCASVT